MAGTSSKESLELIGRIVGTLRSGAAITLPYVDGARGTRWSETFVKGVWGVDGEMSLLHGIDHINRHGVEHKGRREPTDWDLGAMLEQAQQWDDDTISALPPIETFAGDPAVSEVLSLADGERYIHARTWVEVDADGTTRIRTDASGQWQLESIVVREWRSR